jgi:hypothetical protein
MLTDSGQALVALIAMTLLLGAAKALAQRVLLPILGVIILVLVLDHYMPELGLVVKAQELMAYAESQIPPDIWQVVSAKINDIAQWFVDVYNSFKSSNP